MILYSNEKPQSAAKSSVRLKNINFDDAVRLVQAFGFELLRVNGSHHIFQREGVREAINLQNVKGEAKPYQLRQFLQIVERFNLQLEDDA